MSVRGNQPQLTRPVRVLFIGFGSVGQKVAEVLLCLHEEMKAKSRQATTLEKPEQSNQKTGGSSHTLSPVYHSQTPKDILSRLPSLMTAQGSLWLRRVVVVGVTTRTRGCLQNSEGIDLERALKEVRSSEGVFSRENPDYTDQWSPIKMSEVDSNRVQVTLPKEATVTLKKLSCSSPSSSSSSSSELQAYSSLVAASTLDYDVLIEQSTLSLKNKGEPAASHIEAALQRCRHAISANKGPLAFHYKTLTRLAHERSVSFLFESCVMDGAPVFNLAQHCLRGARITAVEGLLNSTSNYVLGALEQGLSLTQAIRGAQDGGFAEADPTLDLDGSDAAAKLAVLGNVLLGCSLTPSDVQRKGGGLVNAKEEEGWEERLSKRVQSLLACGKRLKQVARIEWVKADEEGKQTEGKRMEGEHDNPSSSTSTSSLSSDTSTPSSVAGAPKLGNELPGCTVRASVSLEEVENNSLYTCIHGTGSALKISTTMMTPQWIIQDQPELLDTAYGVLGDLLTVCEKAS